SGESAPGPPDVLDSIIDEAVLSTPSLKHIELADLQAATIGTGPSPGGDTPAADMPAPDSPMPDSPIKVMVIGDSTSYGIAQGLAGATAARFDVLWAGKRNCPL